MPTIVGSFPAISGEDVRLEVFNGDAQPGGSSAVLSGIEIASGQDIDTGLGDGAGLLGAVLVVNTTVRDERSETDWTSATVRLSSRTISREFPQKQLADTNGLVNYLFVITFK